MFAPKIKLDKELYERVKRVADLAGYSSVDEFVAHVLEKELTALGGDSDQESEEKILERLQGLGYL